MNEGYDRGNDMYKISSMQKKLRDSFNGVALDTARWNKTVGAGASVAVGAGALTMSGGTTINSETYIESVDYFTIPVKLLIGLQYTRVANQEAFVEFVSIDPTTLVADGKYCASWKLDGVGSATQGVYEVQTGGNARLASAQSTIVTTASANIFEIEMFSDEVWFHSKLMDSVVGRANSYVRHQQIPEPNGLYKVRIRIKNGGTAPVANNLVSNFIVINDYAELTAEITAGRGQVSQGQSVGVSVVNTPNATVSGNPAVVGNVAHDGAVSGAPVRIAGRALTANYTAVATGDVADFVTTVQGAQIMRPFSIPELDWSFACTAVVANTTDVAIKALVASNRNYLTSLQYQNTNATATEIVVKDGATVIWRGYAPANMTAPANIVFASPLKSTVGTALNFACITTGASVYVDAQGYVAP